MWFLLNLYTFWWFGLHKVYKAMVDYQLNLEEWLEDATLFPTEPNGYNFDLDDLQQQEGSEVIVGSDLPDLQWLDEKINLSFFEDPSNLLIQPNDAETLMIEDAANIFFNHFQSNTNTSCLPSNPKIGSGASDALQYSPVSTDVPQLSPYYETISPASSPVSFVSDIPADSTFYQLCLSPAAATSNAVNPLSVVGEAVCNDSINDRTEPGEGSDYQLCLSPGTMSSRSSVGDFEESNFCQSPAPSSSGDTSVVSVTILNDSVVDPAEKTMTIEEVACSVKERKYIGDGSKVAKVQVSLKNAFHPYAKAKPGSRRKGDRNERKKVQNKEAAARYRIKKRSEETVLSDEVSTLEAHQKELQGKHDDLKSEIKYLKSLMCEMFQKKGLL